MTCFVVDPGTGSLVLVSPQPTNPDATSCPLVVQTFSEASASVLQLTPDQGGQIATAILLVWTVGVAVRLLVRVLQSGDANEDVS